MSRWQSYSTQTDEPPALIATLADAVGIGFSGKAPVDLKVHDSSFYDAVMTDGSLGLGESYMLGHWDCDSLDELFTKALSIDLDKELIKLTPFKTIFGLMRRRLFNLQSKERSNQVALAHYDVGNDVFEAMLDPTMSYSCAYWENANSLEEAQLAKLDLICNKLQLKPGERLLDIGCGWGGLAFHAAKKFGAIVTGVTISKEQQQWAQSQCSGLPISIVLMDYRDLEGTFDKIVSVGMFEHVGSKNYKAFFDKIKSLLKNDGLTLLHTIGTQEFVPHTDKWIDRYIFPNGSIPTAYETVVAIGDALIIEDWHSFGQDYDKTIMAWSARFDEAWEGLSKRYDERFYRMWHYYLMSCAAYFRSRQGHLWQIVLSKRENPNVYRSFR